jgi:sn-glycerol 3-phosphate transport system substrate-binding protein
MIWHTTGNLTNMRKNATFDFGVAPFPGNPKPASVLGGGNLYIFKEATDEQKAAAFKLIQFLTSDEDPRRLGRADRLCRAARRLLGRSRR